ncbi:MAG: Obg family GTPase CgtA, partial [Clostridia bacterium]|nr:Obg family GTPase CgtA [Clostridia bacterium]
RHIERTRMLLHVVDISGSEERDPVEDFKKINSELLSYSKVLASLPQVVALNKCDVYGAEENLKAFKKKYGRKYKIFPITAVNGEGTDKLLEGVFEILETLPPVKRIESDENFTYTKSGNLDYEIYMDGEAYVVVGSLVDMLCRNVSLTDPDSMAYFQKILREKGVISRLKQMGVKENDTVVVGDVEFEFVP